MVRLLRRLGLAASALVVLGACTTPLPTPGASTSGPIVASPAATRPLVLPPVPSPAAPTAPLQPTPFPLPTVPTLTPVPTLPAAVVAFQVTPSEQIAVGSTLSATWLVAGERADLCFICAEPAYCREVPLKGSTTVTIEEGMLACSQLGLRASLGDEFTWSFVDLHYQCPNDWFFAGAPDACPEASTASHAAAQYFQHGFMVWTETPDRFYVFYDDGEYVTIAAPYSFLPSTSVAGPPPAGCYEPVSGFGKVWHGELAGVNAEEVRQRLGWATAPEFAFDTAYQCETMAHPHLWHCYLRAPDGGVLSLRPDSSAQVRFLWERL